MRIIFLGSPQCVVPILENLLDLKSYQTVAVISQPAKSKGRSKTLVDPPVALYAKAKKIKVLQPEKTSDEFFLKELRELKPDICITAAYGKILSKNLLQIPTRATINIHPSLLPKYRGATPVQSALFDGEKTTGITILFTVFELDAGNIIIQKKFPIENNECSEDLLARLFRTSSPMLEDALNTLSRDNNFKGIPQEIKDVTFCHKIVKNKGVVNWNQENTKIYNQYRALKPWPGSYTFFNKKRIILEEVKIEELETNNIEKRGPGSLHFMVKTKNLLVETKNGFIRIIALKPEGKKKVSSTQFWHGLQSKKQTHFNFEHE